MLYTAVRLHQLLIIAIPISRKTSFYILSFYLHYSTLKGEHFLRKGVPIETGLLNVSNMCSDGLSHSLLLVFLHVIWILLVALFTGSICVLPA